MNRYLFRSYIKLSELNNIEPGFSPLHDFRGGSETGLPSSANLIDPKFFQFEPIDRNPELTFINLDGLLAILRGWLIR